MPAARPIHKLTEEQKKLVEDNINFVYWWMNKYHLDPEYLDVMLEALCMAAMSYEDQGYKFVAYLKESLYSAYSKAKTVDQFPHRYNKLKEKVYSVSLDSLLESLDDRQNFKPTHYPDSIKSLETSFDGVEMLDTYYTFKKNLSNKDQFLLTELEKGKSLRRLSREYGKSNEIWSRHKKAVQKKFHNYLEKD